MKLAILLFSGSLAFGQSTPPAPETNAQGPVSSSDQKQQPPAQGRQVGSLGILSDTQGVDFGPYLQGIVQTVRQNWQPFVPESVKAGKKGKLAIEFAITKDGNLANMRLVATSRDITLDRAAWAAITQSNPFPALRCAYASPTTRTRVTSLKVLLSLA
jgi:TonB family protein